MKSEELNKARAIYYGLFCSLFSFINEKKEYENIVNTIEFLSSNPIDEYSEKSFCNMKEFLKTKGIEGLKEESNDLFFSPSTTFIPVTASYYCEDRDDGEKRVQMTNLVLKSKFRKDNNNFKEAEDHICFILNFIQKLIEEDLSQDKNELIYEVYTQVLNEIIDSFIEKIYKHESSIFYKDVAVALKVFIELERALLNIAKTDSSKHRKQQELFHQKKKGFTKRAKRNFDEVTSL
ncbi:TorD/DmsD family molecular chaperone [Malaciobacter marinus]|jgi:TorA maturation chaperone TorD|uniref:TorD/DmsD family molecular chaperone n=1 Tax=Malaciobacter marinus TaxID=505249 RepID=UPI0009A77428|nr:molecular chaperone TorD family protein [Malaciobacter marinus]SKB39164.1 chaperone TorD involved in molybdoenzyme TorA maturation [Malaciobacter marinus]